MENDHFQYDISWFARRIVHFRMVSGKNLSLLIQTNGYLGGSKHQMSD